MKSESNIIQTSNGGRGRFIRYAPVVVWVALIFFASSSSGASNSTSRFIRPLLEWLFPLASDDTLAFYHGYIRKGAHLVIYGSLAAIAWRAFIGSTKTMLSTYPWLASLVLVAVVGSIDEFNQSANPLRTGTASDVLIDLCGGVLAMVLIRLIGGVTDEK